jgi:hypothetical protein
LLLSVLKSTEKSKKHHKSKHSKWPNNPVASVPKDKVPGI